MTRNPSGAPLLLLVAGARGAVASTVAAAVAALKTDPSSVLPYLTTADDLPTAGAPTDLGLAGWDRRPGALIDAVAEHGVLSPETVSPLAGALADMPIRPAPDENLPVAEQIRQLTDDIRELRSAAGECRPVLVNLLPACPIADLDGCASPSDVADTLAPGRFPDMIYVLAALACGVPVVNFTPNRVEVPAVCRAAQEAGIPIAGRDGKTGQTFLKVMLASALKARALLVDGWYSLNILGNADGKNLMDPDCAAGKLANKTDLLDEVLGYRVGAQYDAPAHKVHIDYYPPRGDAKEAWDVIDFRGLFGRPMSIRLNLQGRDSILAAPMVIDLARWVTALHLAGIGGPVPDLAFYYKKPAGDAPPRTFEDQLAALDRLQQRLSD